MEYKIGELLTKHIQKQDIAYRRYAIDCGMSDSELAQIRSGNRAASAKKLSSLIDIELLRQPVMDEINNMLDTLDTETIIDVYNLIYARERDK